MVCQYGVKCAGICNCMESHGEAFYREDSGCHSITLCLAVCDTRDGFCKWGLYVGGSVWRLPFRRGHGDDPLGKCHHRRHRNGCRTNSAQAKTLFRGADYAGIGRHGCAGRAVCIWASPIHVCDCVYIYCIQGDRHYSGRNEIFQSRVYYHR